MLVDLGTFNETPAAGGGQGVHSLDPLGVGLGQCRLAHALDDAARAGIKNTLRSGQCVLHFGDLGQRQRQATGDVRGSRNRLGDGLATQCSAMDTSRFASCAPVRQTQPSITSTRRPSCVVLMEVMCPCSEADQHVLVAQHHLASQAPGRRNVVGFGFGDLLGGDLASQPKHGFLFFGQGRADFSVVGEQRDFDRRIHSPFDSGFQPALE